MNPDDIAGYLRSHPEFFEDYAEVLADVTLPHPHDGRAISLTERQLLTLREKNQLLEGKLRELVGFGEENDAISEKLHRFALTLFAPPNLDALARAVRENLQEIFAVPHAALRIWTGQPDQEGLPEFEAVSLELCSHVGGMASPTCGAEAPHGIPDWFGEDGPRLQSFALVPLREPLATGAEEPFGLLVLASEDARRFHADMGTLFLKRLGDLVSAALQRHLA